MEIPYPLKKTTNVIFKYIIRNPIRSALSILRFLATPIAVDSNKHEISWNIKVNNPRVKLPIEGKAILIIKDMSNGVIEKDNPINICINPPIRP